MHKQHLPDLDERARQAMLDNGFEPDFTPEVAQQIDEIEADGPAGLSPGVRDLRNVLWSSIDNRSSKDLDQVEFAEELENGDIRLLVGIADVDSLVGKGSAIDKHAAENTVTVYTESEIFPVLPEQLSTDLTSLREGEDREAIVVELIIKANGDVPGNNVFRALICNKAKLAYEDVGNWLDENADEPPKITDTSGLREQVRLQKKAADRLHKFRLEKGALEFESVESLAVVVDGEVREIEAVRSNSVQRIIENFMIAANVEMAEFLDLHGSPSIRRIVKTPERWGSIQKIAAEFGTGLPDTPDVQSLSKFLAERRAADPVHFPDLSLSIIKLIGSGEYVVKRPGEDSGGHFGLAVRDYAHSTAPNRRYPDLIVQRLVKAVIAGEPPPYSAEELEAIAEHCNDRERAARKVERKMRKIVAATVMRKHVGQSYQAIVTGKTSKGTFARILRPPVDGRIVRGENGVDVGDEIGVKLLAANPQNGFIDFAAER
jgi:exoribonuclease-2